MFGESLPSLPGSRGYLEKRSATASLAWMAVGGRRAANERTLNPNRAEKSVCDSPSVSRNARTSDDASHGAIIRLCRMVRQQQRAGPVMNLVDVVEMIGNHLTQTDMAIARLTPSDPNTAELASNLA